MFRSLWRIAGCDHRAHGNTNASAWPSPSACRSARIEVGDHGLNFVRRVRDRPERSTGAASESNRMRSCSLRSASSSRARASTTRSAPSAAWPITDVGWTSSDRFASTNLRTSRYANVLRRLVDEPRQPHARRVCERRVVRRLVDRGRRVAAPVSVHLVLERPATSRAVRHQGDHEHTSVVSTSNSTRTCIWSTTTSSSRERCTKPQARRCGGPPRRRGRNRCGPGRATMQAAVQDRATVLADESRDVSAGFDPDAPPTFRASRCCRCRNPPRTTRWRSS